MENYAEGGIFLERVNRLFLEAVGAALKNEQVAWEEDISQAEWSQLLETAEAHKVLPMVYQAIFRCPAAAGMGREMLTRYKMASWTMMAAQVRKTQEFLPILEDLRKSGVEPLVVKGMVCRRLYPNPDLRLSSDEDVLILAEKYPLCHEVLTRHGMATTEEDPEAYEIPYRSTEGVLYLEMHKSLFPEKSDAYGDFNRFFKDIRRRAVDLEGVPTLHPTDHMLYLILHAYKHFLHSGFGIRQVCDMVLYANHYGSEIDWQYVLDGCRQVRAEIFAAGLFRIGRKYLHLSLEDSRFPLQWQAIYVEEGPLLEDILAAGVYGSKDKGRVHSSSITLNAVAAQKQGKQGGDSLLKTVFPPVDTLKKKYPYLKDKPMLLPIAWGDRILQYGRESLSRAGSAPTDSIRIGNERIELLKKYGILDE